MPHLSLCLNHDDRHLHVFEYITLNVVEMIRIYRALSIYEKKPEISVVAKVEFFDR